MGVIMSRLLDAAPVHLPTIHVLSLEALGNRTNLPLNGTGSATFPAANRAILVPFNVYETIRVVRMAVANGAATAGNLDLGIYTADFTRLTSSGSTAQSGTSALQTVTVEASLTPGLYYMAIAMSSASAQVLRLAPLAAFCQSWGMRQMASAFPLPTTITPAAPASSYLPIFGLLHGDEDTII